jgi:hypothetical protein
MTETIPDEVLYALLGVAQQGGQVVEKTAAAIQLLLEKRVTLEEKMIRSYFLEVAQTQSLILKQLFFRILNPDLIQVESKIIEELTEVNGKILLQLESFLKAARHDFNYLEQYFEHEFHEELVRSDLKERSEAVLQAIASGSDNSGR